MLLLICLDIEKKGKCVGVGEVVFVSNIVLFQPGHDVCLRIYVK